MALNNPGNGDQPQAGLIQACLRVDEPTSCSEASYFYDYTRNCYFKQDTTISAREVCSALAERDALRKYHTKLVEALRPLAECFRPVNGPVKPSIDACAEARALLRELGEAE